MLKPVIKSQIYHAVRAGLRTTSRRLDSFKVQDLKDFNARVKNNTKPVIVDFSATWCHPCKALKPRIEDVIAETNGTVDLAIVDIDEHSELALNYDVGTVPALLAIRNGKVEDRMVGLQDVDKLRKFVDKVSKVN